MKSNSDDLSKAEMHVKDYSENDRSENPRQDACTEPKGVATSGDNFGLAGPRKAAFKPDIVT